MSIQYKTGNFKGAELKCDRWNEDPEVSFSGFPEITAGSVKLTVGAVQVLITRTELAAASALFPPLPPVKTALV